MEGWVDPNRLRELMRAVRSKRVSVAEALQRLRYLPFEDLGFATLDHHRALRRGYPEVVYGQGKTAEQVADIAERLAREGSPVLVTRAGPGVFEAVAARCPRAEQHALARCVVVRARSKRPPRPGVVVLTAGTSDIPVAEEAALTAELFGHRVQRFYDVGVAGLHRLLARLDDLGRARVIVAVAGMEGALPSVVAGLTDCPVIGVPTSTGYGVGEGGIAALHAMLNSCASGLAVVNVDNGFGAGFLAAQINDGGSRGRTRSSRAPRSPKPRGAGGSRTRRQFQKRK